jgi:hypothetical protein
MTHRKKQNVYEVSLVSGQAEACTLIAAHSKKEARKLAEVRAHDVAWEGEREEEDAILVTRIENQGPDAGQPD